MKTQTLHQELQHKLGGYVGEHLGTSIMPTPRLCRPMSATRPVWWGSLRWSRHNHRASKNASSVSLGRKRPGFVSIGVVLANARSLISRSACR